MRLLKVYFALAMFLCATALLAQEYSFKNTLMDSITGYNGNYNTGSKNFFEMNTSTTDISEIKTVDDTKAEEPVLETPGEVALDKTMCVCVSDYLNVRKEPWGEIIGSLQNNDQVHVIKSDWSGSWYQIDSPMSGYIHADYVNDIGGSGESATQVAKGSNPTGNNADNNSAVKSDGSLQKSISAKANEFVNNFQSEKDSEGNPTKTSYPYQPETNDGVEGCAQVASDCLREAGVDIPQCLCVDQVTNHLMYELGWESLSGEVTFQEGDVIVWDVPHKQEDGSVEYSSASHIGIVVNCEGNLMAMNNKSSYKEPRLTEIYQTNEGYQYKVCMVLRKK